ncbi:Phage repressor protein C, contains Cro/C1-type HTH and peptisase s24 domains [Kosakonia oryziphila]|uniref:Phage repressor protein C, contains Cro/C1-type HTH and peptisase s24 domains n=2 Tax=Kosakonia oryziphila TaxID=1005667 RepID=A0A1C4GCR8_9ENTR|nr:helix-turn-helix transcriptional regulator [Kosakonia oryziphila]SCC65561.1 Phage repressor protein C, contains Cro/C1-type HTH and peptisase s24 domains [Kosakonia oryziphila]
MVVFSQQPFSFDGIKPQLYISDMKTTLAERLKEARILRGLTQKALGDLIGVSQAAIQKIETGKANQTTKLVDLANALMVRPEWLSSGDGVMREDTSSPVESTAKTPDIYRVDVLDVSASAGPGTMLASDFIETIRAIEYTPEKGMSLFGSVPPSAVKVITVRGDSMEGTIDPGDEIFVNIDIRFFDGDGIYVFVFGNTLHVKRLQMHKDKLLVLSDNQRYKEWYIDEEDQDRFHIMAKVLIKQTIAYKRFG